MVVEFPDPRVLALPAPDAADVADLRRKAVIALSGPRSAAVDISSVWTAAVGGCRVRVHFDKCTHSAGHHRAYVACPLGRTAHPA